MSELYPYKLTLHTIDYTPYFYPENYWGTGWPDQIGPPETWGQYVGFDTVPRDVYPGPPWHGEDLETLTWLRAQSYWPGRGPYGSQISEEFYDPPEGKRFSAIGATWEYGWEEPYNIVLWGEYTWGRFNYRFGGTYFQLEKRPAYSPTCSIIPIVAPLLPLVLLLSGMTAASSGASSPNQAGRRRRKVS